MKTIAELKEALKQSSPGGLEAFIALCRADGRAGAAKLADQAERMLKGHEQEMARLEAMLRYERIHAGKGPIAGIDEVGRGPLAGPVVSAAVILPEGLRIPYVNDSKQCSAKLRESLYDEIMDKAAAVGIGIVPPGTIDRINILQATLRSMQQALGKLSVKPGFLLVDALKIPGQDIPQEAIIKGDEKSQSIAAASIIAKVARDRMMADYDLLYPGYGFASNKGYGSREHIDALKRLGPSPIHRMSFLGNIL